MPELPEVETTKRGIEPNIVNKTIQHLVIRQPKLRWPIPDAVNALVGQKVEGVSRRGKYIGVHTKAGTLIIHLGMSGSLYFVDVGTPPLFHDHVDIELLGSPIVMRYTDPRRFGAMLWQEGDWLEHELLKSLGPEPLTDEFNAKYLYERAKGRKQAIKMFIMDSKVVVGVGNIYANEALFKAGIHPKRAAGNISLARFEKFVSSIKMVLSAAIEQGGTTLKDFVGGDGKPGYFKQELAVYGRAGKPCIECSILLKEIRLGQRSTVYCNNCQA
ncbi:bifunctional DNA-formamidopyrimidine glycosylase/DNA-(apurinic or apyrimidinic site) lyase [Marinomonas balearica]|uniref:Formamidopyrimidine-DNA glycosylase n=1 Tax=Marinomonas balearica TaxID=491947 RepID=A0A4R6M3M9_9GAMM|nr:bifunctional DNA-formamidopyrimidine glycosylase/DNA-(apurinic or apyrimidinic site) lyase [Marinomonas balearica]TDO95891.1 DNA-(apurinic or apyrimidinic site) lyase [Marinomonas balearica]